MQKRAQSQKKEISAACVNVAGLMETLRVPKAAPPPPLWSPGQGRGWSLNHLSAPGARGEPAAPGGTRGAPNPAGGSPARPSMGNNSVQNSEKSLFSSRQPQADAAEQSASVGG